MRVAARPWHARRSPRQPGDVDVRRMIERGVPAVPRAEDVGDELVPVAVWHDGDVAAVLVISRGEHPHEECSGWAQDVDVYIRQGGTWEHDCGAGSCWPVAYGVRPEGTAPASTGFASAHPGRGGLRWLVTCLAPKGVTEVVVVSGGRRRTLTPEPVTGAFIVEAEGPTPGLRFEVG